MAIAAKIETALTSARATIATGIRSSAATITTGADNRRLLTFLLCYAASLALFRRGAGCVARGSVSRCSFGFGQSQFGCRFICLVTIVPPRSGSLGKGAQKHRHRHKQRAPLVP